MTTNTNLEGEMINTDGRPTIAMKRWPRPLQARLVASDTVNRLVAYENGELDSDEALKLIADLVKSGQVWHLQGSYGRFAAQLILAGRITERGEVVD